MTSGCYANTSIWRGKCLLFLPVCLDTWKSLSARTKSILLISGLQCDTGVNECDLWLPCQHNSTCVDLLNDYSCSCMLGFTDKNCSTNIDDCFPDPCYHGSQCVDGVNNFSCLCSPGYTGRCNVFVLQVRGCHTVQSHCNTITVATIITAFRWWALIYHNCNSCHKYKCCIDTQI